MPANEDKNSPARKYTLQWRKDKKQELKAILRHCALEDNWSAFNHIIILTKKAFGIELTKEELMEFRGIE